MSFIRQDADYFLCCVLITVLFLTIILKISPQCSFFTHSFVSCSLWLSIHLLSAPFRSCSEMGRVGPPPIFFCFFSVTQIPHSFSLLNFPPFPTHTISPTAVSFSCTLFKTFFRERHFLLRT